MERLTTLDDVLDRVWTRLSRAAETPGHPFRTLTFGTVREGTPQLRTVVVREARRNESRLAFHTDRRTRKVEAIRAGNRVAWHGWNAETREQIRLQGTATVHLDDAVADAMWEAQSPSSLDVYVRHTAPGTPRDAPGDALDDAVATGTATREAVAEGRQYFAVVRTTIDDIEWLHLHPEGHYRARFEFDADAGAFGGTWIVP